MSVKGAAQNRHLSKTGEQKPQCGNFSAHSVIFCAQQATAHQHCYSLSPDGYATSEDDVPIRGDLHATLYDSGHSSHLASSPDHRYRHLSQSDAASMAVSASSTRCRVRTCEGTWRMSFGAARTSGDTRLA